MVVSYLKPSKTPLKLGLAAAVAAPLLGLIACVTIYGTIGLPAEGWTYIGAFAASLFWAFPLTMMLAPFAYMGMLFFGLPGWLLLRRFDVEGFIPFVAIGTTGGALTSKLFPMNDANKFSSGSHVLTGLLTMVIFWLLVRRGGIVASTKALES